MMSSVALGISIVLAGQLGSSLSATNPGPTEVPDGGPMIASFAVFEPAPTSNGNAPSPATSLGTADNSNAEQPAEAAAPAAPSEEWLLMKTLEGTWLGSLLKENRIEIYGWTDMSFTASSDRDGNLPMGFNYKANDFLLQQNWLRIDRPVDTTSTTDASYGFRFDTILPGSDYRFTVARGLFSDQLSADHGHPDLYGIDPIQFYGEAYYPMIAQGMDVKVGRFFALYGVETNDAISNALFSHAYTFVYDPFTHTGVVTTTKLSDAWTVQAGLVLGSDDFIDPVDTPTFVGSVKWTANDQKDSVLFNVIAGCGRYNQERDFNNPEVFDLVYNHKFSDRLNYNFEGLFGFETNVPDIGTAEWFGILNYLTYQLSPKLDTTTRLEFFDDVQGERTGFRGLYTALTTGLEFKPCSAIVLRPELRYDVNGESRPFENKHDLFTAATDVILRW